MQKTINRIFPLLILLLTGIIPIGASADYQGRTFAVLVGVADYPNSPLPRTDEDASRIARALQAHVPGDRLQMHLLLNQQATQSNVRRALTQVAQQATRDDQIIFFFSGHGTPVADRNGDEPDDVDEALVLIDGNLIDDELAAILEATPAKAMIAIDACFSGGFLFDVGNAKGRMTLLSSDEDLTSAVPSNAGGYLSLALAEALEGQADGAANGVRGQARDGELSALEIEVFIRRRASEMPQVEASDANSRTVGFQFIDVKRTDLTPGHVFVALNTGGDDLQVPAQEDCDELPYENPYGDPNQVDRANDEAPEGNVIADIESVQLQGTADFSQLPNIGDYQLVAGRRYLIETYDLRDNTDTVIELRESSSPTRADPNDGIVAQNDDANGLASRVVFTPTEDGPFYVHVRPYAPDTGGTFSIRIIELR